MIPIPTVKLGRHHLAYLRAIAEGIDVAPAAKLYLGLAHGNAAVTAHRLVMDMATVVIRRNNDPRWRLLGLALPDIAQKTPIAPPIDEWAATQGDLEDFSRSEVEAAYKEAFGDFKDENARRRARNKRLRGRRMDLYVDLENSTAPPISPADPIAVWLEPELTTQLHARGVITLGELRALIGRGGRWWTGLAAYGPVKAYRLAAHVAVLLGPARGKVWRKPDPVELGALNGSRRVNRPAAGPVMIEATNDLEAIHAFIKARAGSPATVKAYTTETERFMMWMVMERERAMSDAKTEDCRDYMAFLAKIPDEWISRNRVARLAPGWAPFAKQLDVTSQRRAVTVVHAMFAWLVGASYLAMNPWVLVQRRIGDDPNAGAEQLEQSRAFTPAVWSVLIQRAAAEEGAPGERMRWVLPFSEATGLRASELLRATRGDFLRRGGQWWLRVHGKGARNRAVPVPDVAMRATQSYFAARGLDFQTAESSTPLLASTTVPHAHLTYSALHDWIKGFVRRAVLKANLPEHEKKHAWDASTHWLRHTHATRGAERGLPRDVLQANLGQADPRTSAIYYKAQSDRRAEEISKVFEVPVPNTTNS